MNARSVRLTNEAWLGIDSASGSYLRGMIPPCHTDTISVYSPEFFRGERFFVRRACASSFLIRNVLIGNRAVSAINGQPLPADIFAVDFKDLPEISFDDIGGKLLKIQVNRQAIEMAGLPWKIPTMSPGVPLIVEVENVGDRQDRFIGAWYGTKNNLW